MRRWHGIVKRGFGVERTEIKGEGFTLVNNDSVEETARWRPNSVGMIVTSVPFSTQYEYSPNYNDFGHTDNNEHFFEQMDFLTPNLLRVLKPGRIAAIHVKDRIVPGGNDGPRLSDGRIRFTRNASSTTRSTGSRSWG
jgi:hypothetical protein